MKAVRIHEHGNVDVLKTEDINKPSCNNNQIRIKVKACSINHLDIWVRNGLPGLPIKLPLILGSDASGTIDKVGKNIKDYSIGDNVVIQPGTFNVSSPHVIDGNENYSSTYGILGETSNGVQAEYITLNSENINLMADHLSFEEAASMQLVFMTSYQMIIKRAKLTKNESILIYGATSGVGSAAIQISKDIGANVITTVGNKNKIDYALQMGADYVFLHDENLINNIKTITDGKGVDVVFEHIGKKTWNYSLKVLNIGGRIVTCGSTTGALVNIDLRYLFMKQQTILGSTMSNIESFLGVMNKIKDKKYKPFIDKIYNFDDIRDAHLRMENRKNFGKIIIVP